MNEIMIALCKWCVMSNGPILIEYPSLEFCPNPPEKHFQSCCVWSHACMCCVFCWLFNMVFFLAQRSKFWHAQNENNSKKKCKQVTRNRSKTFSSQASKQVTVTCQLSLPLSLLYHHWWSLSTLPLTHLLLISYS